MTDKPNNSWRKFRSLRTSRKALHRRAQQLETISIRHAHKFILDRVDSIRTVKRHAIGWLGVMALLIGLSTLQLIGYQRSFSSISPIEGGTYAEGVVGPIETFNPLFARSSAEQSASRLLFSSLLSYDTTGHLRGELAQSWTPENGGKRYVVNLRQGIKWHDGRPFTANDVVFTVSLIKNQFVRSPLYNSWSSIKITKLSDSAVAFDLARPYAAFPHALTFGVLPRHALSGVVPERLRESDFESQPIGTGSFMFSRRQIVSADEGRSIVYMTKNPRYFFGSAKLDKFQLHVFKDTAQIKKSFLMQEINAGTDFSSQDLADVVAEQPNTLVFDTKTLNGMYAFMRNDALMFSDKNVRRAFLMATDRKAIIKSLHGYASLLEGPLTTEQLPSMANRKQADFNISEANKLLDQAGWKIQGNTRAKDGVPLVINLVSVKSGDYPLITEQLKKQWEKLGATVMVRLIETDIFQQSVLLPRNYDVLVYELELGADPDLFAYWHASQADPRGLNLANYKSDVSSEALSSAQLRLETNVRQSKYDIFADTWLADTPAIALYQPQLHYATSEDADTIQVSNSVATRTGRYRSVNIWTVESGWRNTSQ